MFKKLKSKLNIKRSGFKFEYFPNRSHDVIIGLHKFRNLSESLSETDRYELFSELSKVSLEYVETYFKTQGRDLLVSQMGSVIRFPHPLPTIKFCHLLCGYEEWLLRKYSLPGFVEVEKGDLVIDCGAYVGGFSLSAVKLASELHIFEPDEHNFACCKANLSIYDTVRLNNKGLYNRTDTLQFHISDSSVEHSILPPDDGIIKNIVKLRVISLADYCKDNNIESIDFLKLEAEGVEPEIFEGLGSIRPKKLAVDVSPEREGASPVEYFKRKLNDLEYTVKVRDNVLFAKIGS